MFKFFSLFDIGLCAMKTYSFWSNIGNQNIWIHIYSGCGWWSFQI